MDDLLDALDHPGLYTVRGWTLGPSEPRPDLFCLVFKSLDVAREAVPLGLYRLARRPEDEPHIVENWV